MLNLYRFDLYFPYNSLFSILFRITVDNFLTRIFIIIKNRIERTKIGERDRTRYACFVPDRATLQR